MPKEATFSTAFFLAKSVRAVLIESFKKRYLTQVKTLRTSTDSYWYDQVTELKVKYVQRKDHQPQENVAKNGSPMAPKLSLP